VCYYVACFWLLQHRSVDRSVVLSVWSNTLAQVTHMNESCRLLQHRSVDTSVVLSVCCSFGSSYILLCDIYMNILWYIYVSWSLVCVLYVYFSVLPSPLCVPTTGGSPGLVCVFLTPHPIRRHNTPMSVLLLCVCIGMIVWLRLDCVLLLLLLCYSVSFVCSQHKGLFPLNPKKI